MDGQGDPWSLTVHRLRAMSARVCSSANSVFLTRSPSRRRTSHTALCEMVIRVLADPFGVERPVRLKHPLAAAAHLYWCNRAHRPVALRPLGGRRHRYLEPGGRRSAPAVTAATPHSRRSFERGRTTDSGPSSQHLESQNQRPPEEETLDCIAEVRCPRVARLSTPDRGCFSCSNAGLRQTGVKSVSGRSRRQ
jgi:hypothetical protein